MLTIYHASAPDQLEQVAPERVSSFLQGASQSLWFHLDSPTSEELAFLEKELRIHHLTLEDIVKQNQRPKIETFDHYVYIAIHPLVQKDHWIIEPSELDLLLGRHWLVSAHAGPLPALMQNSHFNERIVSALSRGADFLLYTLVDLVVDSYFPILDAIDDEIDDLEDRLLEVAKREDMHRLLTLKRSLVQIRRAVAPQREVFNQLTRHDLAFVQPENTVYFRDVYDHLIRITEELDSLRDILSGALEIHLAAASNQLNLTMKRLTAWGTIFVVITAITGIYGMNFEHMPELKWRYGYFAVMSLIAFISGGLYFYFKRRDYL